MIEKYKKGYRKLPSGKRLKLFWLILQAYVVDNSRSWFNLWNYQNVYILADIFPDFETEEAYKNWRQQLSELEYYYYRKILSRAKTYKSFHLVHTAALVSGTEEDRVHVRIQMAKLSRDQKDWIEVWKLFPPSKKAKRS